MPPKPHQIHIFAPFKETKWNHQNFIPHCGEIWWWIFHSILKFYRNIVLWLNHLIVSLIPHHHNTITLSSKCYHNLIELISSHHSKKQIEIAKISSTIAVKYQIIIRFYSNSSRHWSSTIPSYYYQNSSNHYHHSILISFPHYQVIIMNIKSHSVLLPS